MSKRERLGLLRFWCEEEGLEAGFGSIGEALYFKHFRMSDISLACLPCCQHNISSGTHRLWFVIDESSVSGVRWSDPSFFEELKSYLKEHEACGVTSLETEGC